MRIRVCVFCLVFALVIPGRGAGQDSPLVRPEPLDQLSRTLGELEGVIDQARGYIDQATGDKCPDLDAEQARRIVLAAAELEDLLRHYPGLVKKIREKSRDNFLQKVKEVGRKEEEVARLQLIFAWQNYVLSVTKATLDLADVMSLGKDLGETLLTKPDPLAVGLVEKAAIPPRHLLNWSRQANDVAQALEGALGEAEILYPDDFKTPDHPEGIEVVRQNLQNIHAAIDGIRKWEEGVRMFNSGLIDASKITELDEAFRGDLFQLVGGVVQSWAEHVSAKFAARIAEQEGLVRSDERNLRPSFRDWQQYSLVEGRVDNLIARLKSTRKGLETLARDYFGSQQYRLYPVPPSYPTAGEGIRHLEKDLPQRLTALLEAARGFRIDRPVKPQLRLEKDSFQPEEEVTVRFSAPTCLPKDSYLSINSSDTPHGSEEVNDQRKIGPHQFLDKRKEGTVTFKAPTEPGSYDVRMNDSHQSGKELFSITFSVTRHFTIKPFDATVWPRTDADIGVAGFVIEDFEDAALAQGLQVELSDSADSFRPTGSLPMVFNPNNDDPNSESFFTAGVWDGSRVLINRRTPPPDGYSDLSWGDVTFHVTGGASSFGFSLQNMDLDAELFVNGVSQGNLSGHLSTGSGRNGYLRIDAGSSGAIFSVKVANGAESDTGDGLVFDHVAFKPRSR